MSLSQRIQNMRKKSGMSQEDLAEELMVSRQAVGKWETGQAIPELEKLILLSDLFRVPIDRLVREDEACDIKLGGDAYHPDDEVINFLIRAKKATYAGYGNECNSSRKGSHDLEYSEGDLYYYDTYLGSEKFTGEEALWIKDKPVWSMNYSGRITGEGFSGGFLKSALSNARQDMPYRGPMVFREGAYSYHCKVDGDMTWFQGYEEIFLEDRKIYECHFHGGVVSE